MITEKGLLYAMKLLGPVHSSRVDRAAGHMEKWGYNVDMKRLTIVVAKVKKDLQEKEER